MTTNIHCLLHGGLISWSSFSELCMGASMFDKPSAEGISSRASVMDIKTSPKTYEKFPKTESKMDTTIVRIYMSHVRLRSTIAQ